MCSLLQWYKAPPQCLDEYFIVTTQSAVLFDGCSYGYNAGTSLKDFMEGKIAVGDGIAEFARVL